MRTIVVCPSIYDCSSFVLFAARILAFTRSRNVTHPDQNSKRNAESFHSNNSDVRASSRPPSGTCRGERHQRTSRQANPK